MDVVSLCFHQMPGSSDAMFLQKLYNNFINKNSIPRESPGKPATHFSKPRTSTTSFNIHHYAYVVTYEKECFIEKNMDSLLPEHKQLLQKSKVHVHACTCTYSYLPQNHIKECFCFMEHNVSCTCTSQSDQ